MDAVGRLAGRVAHDLDNALTVIRTSTGVLLEVGEPGMVLDEARSIAAATERAAEVTRGLLTLSRSGPGTPVRMDANVVVGEMRSRLAHILLTDQALALDLGTAVPPIYMDEDRFRHLLVILVENARDAMGAGGRVTVRTRASEGEAADEECVTLVVEDTGHGMTEATMARMFEAFFTTRDPEQGAAGLGLAAAYAIVSQAGGAIGVESAPGRGTTVSVSFPTAGMPSAPGGSGALEVVAPAAHARGGTVLLLDDEEPVRTSLRRVLVRWGHHVAEASHGREALTMADNLLGGTIDVLVTDLVMPGMPAEETAARLIDRFPDLGIVLVTAADVDEPPAFVRRARRWAVVRKPFDLPSFVAAVEKVRPDVGLPSEQR